MKQTTIFLLIACYYSALKADLQNDLVTLQRKLTILHDVLSNNEEVETIQVNRLIQQKYPQATVPALGQDKEKKFELPQASTPAIQESLDNDYKGLNGIQRDIDIFEQALDEFLEWAKNYAQSTEQNDDVKSPAFEDLMYKFNQLPGNLTIIRFVWGYNQYEDTATKQDARAIAAYLEAVASALHRIINLIETDWKNNFSTLNQIIFKYESHINNGADQYKKALYKAAQNLEATFFTSKPTLPRNRTNLNDAIQKWKKKAE